MSEIDGNLAADIKNKVVKVTALGSVFPPPAQNRVYLSRKQGRRVVQADFVRNRKKSVLLLIPRKRRRVGIDLELYLHGFVSRDKSRETVLRVKEKQLLARVPLYERRLDERVFRLGFDLRFEIQAVRPHLVFEQRNVRRQIERVIRFRERKIQVLGETVEPVEYAERRTAVKGGVLEEVRS